MPPFMRGPPGQKFVVSHSTFDPAMVGTCRSHKILYIIRFCSVTPIADDVNNLG